MRITYRKFVFNNPRQFNKINYEELKSSNNYSNLKDSFKFFQDLKIEIAIILILCVVFVIELTIPNTLIEIILVITILISVINVLPTIFSYIELRIYTIYYYRKLKADLKTSTSYENFKKKRMMRGFIVFEKEGLNLL